MNNQESRLKGQQRQRQKVSRKMIIIISSSIACLVIALVVVFNFSNVQQAKADQASTSSNVVIIPEQVYSTEIKMNEAPQSRTTPIDHAAQLGHVAKTIKDKGIISTEK